MVCAMDGRTLLIKVESQEKVTSLKDKVREREGNDVWPRLIKSNREMNDEDTMEACKIRKGDSIRVIAGLPGGMKRQSHQERNIRRSRARGQKREK